MKTSPALFSSLALAISTNALGSSLDVDINSDSLRGQYNVSDRNASLGISGSIMLTDDNGEVYAFTARTQGQLADRSPVKGGFGGRVYHASPDSGDSIQALGIGGFIGFSVPEIDDFSVEVELYYAPSIMITDNFDNMTDLQFRASYQLFENAAVYAGFRNIEVEIGDFNFEFADGFHLGFSAQF